jgi:hypothetical protein
MNKIHPLIDQRTMGVGFEVDQARPVGASIHLAAVYKPQK